MNANNIQPPHAVRDEQKLNDLTTSMAANGWLGRPVVIIDNGDLVQGSTGSHRIAAARIANIDVPAYSITDDEYETLDDAGLIDAYNTIVDAEAAAEWLNHEGVHGELAALLAQG